MSCWSRPVSRAPILPLFTQLGGDYSQFDTLPALLYWSRNELFEFFDEGSIRCLVGNAGNLGFLALLAVIVFATRLADRSVGRSVDFSAGTKRSTATYRAILFLPLLILTALIAQSFAESRLLGEYGELFLVIVSVRTKAAVTPERLALAR